MNRQLVDSQSGYEIDVSVYHAREASTSTATIAERCSWPVMCSTMCVQHDGLDLEEPIMPVAPNYKCATISATSRIALFVSGPIVNGRIISDLQQISVVVLNRSRYCSATKSVRASAPLPTLVSEIVKSASFRRVHLSHRLVHVHSSRSTRH